MTKRGWLALAAVAVAAVACALALGVATGRAHSAAATCKQRLSGKAVHYCGPATAHLSVFKGVTFRNGTCHVQKVSGQSLMSLGIGIRTQNSATNNGKPYFGLTLSGSASHPTGGGVVAYYKGKRWGGRGVSFKGTLKTGTFVARGIRGSKGTATGSFHC